MHCDRGSSCYICIGPTDHAKDFMDVFIKSHEKEHGHIVGRQFVLWAKCEDHDVRVREHDPAILFHNLELVVEVIDRGSSISTCAKG